jgi:predicted ATPase
MSQSFVEKLAISNYGCIQAAEIPLTRLHAFIGPNDSGKSTILRAAETLAVWSNGAPDDQRYGQLHQALVANAQQGEVSLAGHSVGVFFRTMVLNGSLVYEEGGGSGGERFGSYIHRTGPSPLVGEPRCRPIIEALAGAQLLRLDPDALRANSALIPENHPIALKGPRGHGLAGIYDALLKRDTKGFLKVVDQLKELFPQVESVRPKNVSESSMALAIELTNGQSVPPDFVSEGLLYYLAFAALPYLQPSALLLVEEPENGLHPARIADVVRILRKVSELTQVLIATHSPLVVNELKGDEVTIVTRDAKDGTKTKRMSETPDFVERSKVYALGELWLSYSDGKQEAPLFSKPSKSL